MPWEAAREISTLAKEPAHLKISSLSTERISSLSLRGLKSLTIFWKSDDGKLIIDEKDIEGIANSSQSGSINLNFWILHCFMSPFSNFNPKNVVTPSL